MLLLPLLISSVEQGCLRLETMQLSQLANNSKLLFTTMLKPLTAEPQTYLTSLPSSLKISAPFLMSWRG